MYYDQKITSGLSLLSQGSVKEADEIFCDVLKETPDFPEALYGRACVARMAGEPTLAIGFAGRAIEIKPQSYYYITLGLALYEAGHIIEGEASLKSAVLLNVYDPRAHHGLAIVQEALGEQALAELAFRKAVELQPASFTFWKELIRFYWQGKSFEQALNIAKDAVNNNPGKIEFLHELGIISYQLGLLGDAERVFRKIIRLNSEAASAYANLGAVLFQLKQLKEAKAYLTTALQKAPEVIETKVNLGLVEMGLGALLEAKALLQNAYQHSPQDARVGLNLGTIYYELRELDEAENIYRQFLEQGHAVAITKNDRDKIEYNLSTTLLAKGKFLEGWQYMEARHHLLNHFAENDNIPVWNGKDKAEIILVRVEQGLGDAIHFARFLPALIKKNEIIIEAPKVLVRLFQAMMSPYDKDHQWQVVEKGQVLPENVTHQIMLMSVPYLLEIEHISAYQLDINQFENALPSISSHHLKVGICWSGNKEYRFDRLRSVPITEFLPLLNLSKIVFYALQTEIKKTDLPKGFAGILPSGDIFKTACFIQELDLVITVDTVIAHLAGMLGKPVWLLNRFGGDWRWYSVHQDQQGRSLWYPTLRVFQQKQPLRPDQAWKSLIQEVKVELVKMI